MPEVLTRVHQEGRIENELDKRVAHEVMRLVPCGAWKKVNFGRAGGPALMGTGCEHNGQCYPNIETSSVGGPIGGVPRYSESIAAAMEVVEKMWRSGWTIEMANCGKVGTLAIDRIVNWYVRFIEDENDMNNWSAEADTLPEAICRAALAAMESKDGNRKS